MKFLAFLSFLFFCSLGAANAGVEIPRSNTVELTEPSTKKIYPIFIKIPRSYQSSKARQYPVIYLMDAPYSFQIASGSTRFSMNSDAIEFGEREDMVFGAKQLAEKIKAQSGENTLLKFSVIDGTRHATAFPTTLIQGLDWIYGKE